MKKYKNILFMLMTMFAILAQLVNPTLAYADGEPPLPPTDAAPTDLPTVTDLPTQPDAMGPEAAPTELPVATDIPASDSPTVDTVATDIPTADTPTAEEPTLLEIMEQIPAQTDIVVLDANGEAMPLATQEAADVIVEGDPMWCPAGATTVTVNCVNAATVSALLPLLASKNEDGIIYFYTPTAYNINDVTFDGTNLNLDQLADNALTIQGGWGGNPNLGSAITFSGNSLFSVPISIINWTGAVAVNNITVNGASGTGLTVTTAGNISLDNVSSNNNLGLGASIDNTTSSSSASVTLTGDNTFNGNDLAGLYILSNGNVSANMAWGVRKTPGLLVWSDGNISLNNVTANGNGGKYDCTSDGNWSDCYSGITLKNYYGTGNVTLTGTNEFSNNQGWGLYVDSYGAISLENINATYNGLEGANLYGFQKDITLTGKNAFNSNGKYGEWSGLFIGTFGDVIISGSNEFNNNYYDGVEIWSLGNISLNSIIAKNNAYSGAYFSTPQDVTVYSSVFSDNKKYGVDAYDVCGSLNFDSSTLTAFNSNVSGDYLNPAGGDYTFYYYDANTDKYEETTIPCKGEVTVDGKSINPNATLNSVLEARGGNEVEFDLSCERRGSFPVTLTNGDKIEIICPVSGTARIKRLDNTMLPAELPAGYTYTSAFSLEIIKNNNPIDYIDEGGSVKVSFEVPYMEEGVAYSILYLDNGIWVPLKEFMLDGNGNPRGFNLHADDLRKILSGSNFIFEEDSPTRLEISTNFPGIFVLAQH
ncbi:MAG: hypothetical protein IPO22_00740 [Anaerolineales bacterium]|nr:hypothetical protein [Anaerolineales bacterium]